MQITQTNNVLTSIQQTEEKEIMKTTCNNNSVSSPYFYNNPLLFLPSTSPLSLTDLLNTLKNANVLIHYTNNIANCLLYLVAIPCFNGIFSPVHITTRSGNFKIATNLNYSFFIIYIMIIVIQTIRIKTFTLLRNINLFLTKFSSEGSLLEAPYRIYISTTFTN